MTDVLILAPFDHAETLRLSSHLAVVVESWLDTDKVHDPEELGERLRREGVRHLVVEADFVFSETMEHAPSLQMVALCRNALNHVDKEAASELGVLVVNAPGRNGVAVAELTVAMVLGLARPLVQAHEYVRSGLWTDPAGGYRAFRGIELAGKTAGIVGLGAIGRLVTARLLAFGMRVVGADPQISAGEMAALGVERQTLDALLTIADYVLLHVPASSQTIGLIGRRELGRMKPGAYLVNTSAPGVCDEAALVEALRQHRLAGAALDVFDGQPLPSSSPLLKLDNVLLTPHIGGATAETVQRYSRMIADDILLLEAGKRPQHLVNPEAWDRRRLPQTR